MSLAQVISEVGSRVSSANQISLFLDFDGTLVPITADPATPRLDPAVSATLQSLADQAALVVTIISGRAIEDLYSRVRLPSLIYAGNHGLEIFGRRLQFVEPVAFSRRERLAQVCEELTIALCSVPGSRVEDKGLTASVHFRQAREADRKRIFEAVYSAVPPNSREFRVNRGKEVLEIIPRTNWHKGAAIHWINKRIGARALCIYLGDDTTDEDAFAVLPDALTIRVGLGAPTRAGFQLPDCGAVHEFLGWLATQEVSRGGEA